MQDFVATNPLEAVLQGAQDGKVQPSKLFDVLYASQVFVLINQDPGPGGQWTDDTTLLVLNNKAGAPVIAMFTSLERTAGWAAQSPEFQYTLQVDFGWLLNGIKEGVGIALNPGSPVGVEMAPELVARLQESIGARPQ